LTPDEDFILDKFNTSVFYLIIIVIVFLQMHREKRLVFPFPPFAPPPYWTPTPNFKVATKMAGNLI